VQLARLEGHVRAVTVVSDHEVTEMLANPLNAGPLQRRRRHAASSVLQYVQHVCNAAGVPVEKLQTTGPAAEELIKQPSGQEGPV
jgi:hypothetical protein